MRVLLFVLGISCSVYARQCKNPQPLDNFSLEKLSGKWFIASYDPQDPIDAVTYQSVRCGLEYLHLDNGYLNQNKWEFRFHLGTVLGGLDGPYYTPESEKGFMKLFYTAGNFTYDQTVLCTDYTTYYAAYSCAEVTPEYISEFAFLFVRDLSAIDDVLANPRLQSCYKEVLTKSITEVRRVPFNDCPDS